MMISTMTLTTMYVAVIVVGVDAAAAELTSP